LKHHHGPEPEQPHHQDTRVRATTKEGRNIMANDQPTGYQPGGRVYRWWDAGTSMEIQPLTVVRVNRVTVSVRTDQGSQFRIAPADIAGPYTDDGDFFAGAGGSTQGVSTTDRVAATWTDVNGDTRCAACDQLECVCEPPVKRCPDSTPVKRCPACGATAEPVEPLVQSRRRP
jgi:hypothetical protein